MTIRAIRPNGEIGAPRIAPAAQRRRRNRAASWRASGITGARTARPSAPTFRITALNFMGRPAIFVLADDVTEQINAEAEAQRSNQMLETVIDNIPQRIFWKDQRIALSRLQHGVRARCRARLPGAGGRQDRHDLPWRALADDVPGARQRGGQHRRAEDELRGRSGDRRRASHHRHEQAAVHRQRRPRDRRARFLYGHHRAQARRSGAASAKPRARCERERDSDHRAVAGRQSDRIRESGVQAHHRLRPGRSDRPGLPLAAARRPRPGRRRVDPPGARRQSRGERGAAQLSQGRRAVLESAVHRAGAESRTARPRITSA